MLDVAHNGQRRINILKKFVNDRIVVTGTGCVTPLGVNTQMTYNACIENHSGIRRIKDGPTLVNAKTHYAGQIHDKWDSTRIFPEKKHRMFDRFMLFMFDAVDQALEQSDPLAWYDTDRIGLSTGSGVGGLQTYYEASVGFKEDGYKKFSPFWLPKALINLAGGHMSQHWKIKGPQQTAAAACATSAQSIVNAVRMIQLGEADCVIAGGAEAAINNLGMAGFGAMKALSTGWTDEPHRASRPWDKQRDGFVMGEGAGAVIIETETSAKKRGANILAYIAGIGQSSDAHHYTTPENEGEGQQRAMRMALESAEITADNVGYVNAHATSTPLGDDAELRAIENVFENTTVSSTKSHMGHLLGAAGVVESIVTIESLRWNRYPGTLNLEEPSQESTLQRPTENVHLNVEYAMSNSFAFGGINCSLLFQRS